MPGFGVAGVSGLVLTFGSLVMASRRVAWPESGEALASWGVDVLTVVGAFAGFLIALLVLAHYIGDIPGLSRLTLRPQLAGDGVAQGESSDQPALAGWQRLQVGDVGQTISALRPSGKIQFGDDIVDVVTEGDFVEAATPVRVIRKQGARVVVRPTAG